MNILILEVIFLRLHYSRLKLFASSAYLLMIRCKDAYLHGKVKGLLNYKGQRPLM